MAPIVLAVVTVVLAVSFFLWWRAIDLWRSGQPLLPAAIHPPARWGLLDLGIAVGCWLAFNIAAAVLIQTLLNLPTAEFDSLGVHEQKTALLILELANLATCAVIAVVFRVRHRISLRELGWDSGYLLPDILLGLKAFAMLVPVVYGLQFLLTQLVDSKHPLIEMLKESPDPAFFAVAAFAAVIAAPITEEFFFRVLLQGWFERLFSHQHKTSEEMLFGTRQAASPPTGQFADSNDPVIAEAIDSPNLPSASRPFQGLDSLTSPIQPIEGVEPVPENDTRQSWWPIAASSLIFALSHWSHGPDPIPLFVFAAGLGYLYQRTNRILPSIVLHLLLNLCSLILLAMSIGA